MNRKRTIAASEARNRFATLLDWVEAGNEVLITRHGRPIARLVGAHRPRARREAAAAAAARILERGRTAGTAASWHEWKVLRDAGRR